MKLDLARRIRAIAELVLEPKYEDRVALAVRRPSRHQKAAQAVRRLRQHKERIAHRRRHEPFVAIEAETAVGGRLRACRIGAQVRAALVLGHAHADKCRSLQTRRPKAAIVFARVNSRQPFVRDLRRVPQCRHRAIGHRERAINAAFDLPEHVSPGGAGHVRARFWICPRTRMKTSLEGDFEQLMPGRVKLDFVEPVTVTVECTKLRRELVGIETELHGLGLAEPSAQFGQIRLRPSLRLRGAPPRATPHRSRTDYRAQAAAAGSDLEHRP